MSVSPNLTVREYDAVLVKVASDEFRQKIEVIYGAIQAMTPVRRGVEVLSRAIHVVAKCAESDNFYC